MSSLNKVILIGNLGDDPVPIAANAAKFSLATNESYKNKDGEIITHTEWHSIVVFNEHLSKYVLNYFKKGSKAYVEGKISTNEYENKEGIRIKKTEIVLSNRDSQIKLMGRNENREENKYEWKSEKPCRN
jgi:single-strand DNA-binding protein